MINLMRSNLGYSEMQKVFIERSKSLRKQYKHLFVDVPAGQKGDWTVKKFNVPKTLTISIMRTMMQHGDRTVYAGKYTSLVHAERGMVMSDTIAEINDHMEFIDKVKRFSEDAFAGKINHLEAGYRTRVLINGLGLGMVLKAVLSNEHVNQVDVIEMDADVIDLVAPTYRSDPRVTIYHADAYHVKWGSSDSWDFVWHDIWDNVSSDNLPGMMKLHRKYGRRVKVYQGSWCRKWCEIMRKENKEDDRVNEALQIMRGNGGLRL